MPSAGLHSHIRIVGEGVFLCLGDVPSLHLRGVSQEHEKLEVLYVVSSLLVPAVLACVPFATHSYRLQGSVCWIQSWKDNCPTNIAVVGVVEQFALIAITCLFRLFI